MSSLLEKPSGTLTLRDERCAEEDAGDALKELGCGGCVGVTTLGMASALHC